MGRRPLTAASIVIGFCSGASKFQAGGRAADDNINVTITPARSFQVLVFGDEDEQRILSQAAG